MGVMAAQPIPVDEAIARFGESGLASCSCEHPLISHLPPVYECLTSIFTSWGTDGMPTQGYCCPCEQFEPAASKGPPEVDRG